jgi:hypothetical protein
MAVTYVPYSPPKQQSVSVPNSPPKPSSSLSQVNHASGNVAVKTNVPNLQIIKGSGGASVSFPATPLPMKLPVEMKQQILQPILEKQPMLQPRSVSNVVSNTANIAATQNAPKLSQDDIQHQQEKNMLQQAVKGMTQADFDRQKQQMASQLTALGIPTTIPKQNIIEQNKQVNQQPFFSKEGQMARLTNMGKTMAAIPIGIAAQTGARNIQRLNPNFNQTTKPFGGLNKSDAINIAGKGYVQGVNQSYKASMIPFKQSMMQDRLDFAGDIAAKKLI